jgi:hypothetical protein
MGKIHVQEEMDVSFYYKPEELNKVIQYFDNDEDQRTESQKREQMSDEIALVLNNLKIKSRNFIEHITGVLGQIKPILDTPNSVNVNKTLAKDNFRNIVFKDTHYSDDDIVTYIKFLRLMNWSDFVAESQSKPGEFNSGVPLLLYAQRLYNSVPYSAWQSVSKISIPTLLGKSFSSMPTPDEFELEYPITKLRVLMVTGKLGQVPHQYSYTARKFNKTTNIEFNGLPSFLKMMLAQIWIFNSQLRNKNMILDWKNWDNIPESIDSPITTQSEKITTKKSTVDLVLGY